MTNGHIVTIFGVSHPGGMDSANRCRNRTDGKLGIELMEEDWESINKKIKW